MGEISNIEWCDSTFNPWEGCQKVGPGCDNCYAEARNARWNGGEAVNWGPGALRRRTSPTNWKKPKQWNRDAAEFQAKHGRRQRVFCASLADVFDNAVEVEWRLDLFKLIEKTPELDWLLLTKRIGNVPDMLPLSWREGLPANVWLGISVVTQQEADRDISKLFEIPAYIRFLSCEPLLERISFDAVDLHTVDWVIVGGESGPKARDNGFLQSARWIRDQCLAAGVPFFGKQGVHKAPLPQDLDLKQFPGAYDYRA